MRSVTVIGIGETKFGKFPETSLKDLILEADTKAIADAGNCIEWDRYVKKY